MSAPLALALVLRRFLETSSFRARWHERCSAVVVHMKKTFIATLVVTLPIAAACASNPPPVERMVAAESSVRAARELGADNVPTAQLHVKLADEEIQKAKALAANDENDRADTMLQRAAADADLALALAREQSSQVQAQRVVKEAQELKTTPAP